jgi:formylmethanofuran dehydrogenase subunit E
MTYPEFYDKVETITLFDPLSELLGSFDEGLITFKYQLIVKAAGHSCPTVAGAYLMTEKALKALYDNEIPVRGEIKVEFKEDIEEGVAGVIGNVISNITGATRVTGFKGLAGKYVRHSLMKFNSGISSSARFTRTDNGKKVDVYYDPSSVGADSQMGSLMQKVVMNVADDTEKSSFKRMWQQRVKEILIDNSNNPEVIRIELVSD